MSAAHARARRPHATTRSAWAPPSRAPHDAARTSAARPLHRLADGLGGAIQRLPIDKEGAVLHSAPAALTKAGKKRLKEVSEAHLSHVFEDKAAFQSYLKTGSPAFHKLNVKPDDYTKKLATALPNAKRRLDLAPLKARTEKGGLIVTDLPAFHELGEHQVPPFPLGNSVYRSQKRKGWKLRKEKTFSDDWRLAAHQDDPKGPVALNMTHEGKLVWTLFQYSQGKSRGPRQMAGLTTKRKWQGKDIISQSSKKRQLNRDAHPTTIVQGHGQDYEHSMDSIGDYDDKHKQRTELTVAEEKIKNSDNHPLNFSGEYAVYGKNFRNLVLNEAKALHPKGSIVEHTAYHAVKLKADLPKGHGDVYIPKEKTLTTLDPSGKPVLRVQLPQFLPDPSKPGHFLTADYARMAEAHAHKAAGTASMHDLVEAAKVDEKPVLNPSYVPGPMTLGINAWDSRASDDAKVTELLKRKSAFQYLKDKDF